MLIIAIIFKFQQSNARYSVRIVNQTFSGVFSVTPVNNNFVGRGSVFLQIDKPEFLDYDIPLYRNQIVTVNNDCLNILLPFVD